MADQAPVRILLADCHSLFREAVKVVLDNETDLKVVAEGKDGLQAVAEATRVRPDVALIDANLPNCDGVRATVLIRERVPECRVLMVASEESQKTLIEAVEAGASGYITKECPLAHLIEAARMIHRGEILIPQHMLGALLAHLIRHRREQDDAFRRISNLTKREKEVLALLAGGADNDAIAEALVISPQTARTHIQNVLSKLNVHSRLEAAAFVVQNAMLPDLDRAYR